MELNISMIDYEVLKDKQGRRLLGFGRYAGIVGAYNSFLSYGLKSGNYKLKPAHECDNRVEMEKEQQQTNWADLDLSPKQLKYAANDVLRLLEIHDHLQDMIEKRVQLQGGKTVFELNQIAQSMLPGMVDLLIHGYGDLDRGWQTTLFSH